MTATTCNILRRRDVLARTGLSNTSLHRHIRAGTFPRPIALGVRAVGWTESSVSEWIESRPLAPSSAPRTQPVNEAA
jgi:prophage regulatory protein